MSAAKIDVPMVYERATKRFYFYQAIDSGRQIENVYVSREAFDGDKPPRRITITIMIPA